VIAFATSLSIFAFRHQPPNLIPGLASSTANSTILQVSQFFFKSTDCLIQLDQMFGHDFQLRLVIVPRSVDLLLPESLVTPHGINETEFTFARDKASDNSPIWPWRMSRSFTASNKAVCKSDLTWNNSSPFLSAISNYDTPVSMYMI